MECPGPKWSAPARNGVPRPESAVLRPEMECSDPGLTPLSVLVRVPDAAVCESGTMTRLILKDELLDAQLLRTIGTAPYGGGAGGRGLATAPRGGGGRL